MQDYARNEYSHPPFCIHMVTAKPLLVFTKDTVHSHHPHVQT